MLVTGNAGFIGSHLVDALVPDNDVVRANLLAATTDVVGEPSDVATGEQTTVLDIADAIVEATGSDAEITHIDPHAGDIRRSRADVREATEPLGVEASVELDKGIERLVTRETAE